MSDLASLILSAAIEAEIELGRPSTEMTRRYGFPTDVLDRSHRDTRTRYRKEPKWSPEEDQFLKDHLGFISETEIGIRLSEINGGRVRTNIAVRVRWKRDLGLPSPMQDSRFFTANRIGEMLGMIDPRPVGHWIESGVMPGHPIAYDSGRLVRRVWKSDFWRWVVNPDNWVYFDIFDIPRGTKVWRMVHMRRRRWGDCWLTTPQAAKMLSVNE